MVGVHLTPRVDGRVLIGPNAALALAKEGYRFWNINIRDILVFATTKGLWKLVLGNPSTVFTEVWRDINKRAFVGEAQRYILLFVWHWEWHHLCTVSGNQKHNN
jgi:2-hydroxyglutarate dehydrogenase